MSVHPRAGQPPIELVDITALIDAYYQIKPNVENPEEQVSFGTSGHRGSSLRNSCTETHVAAIVQASCDHRKSAGITGPMFLGGDTHALTDPAIKTAIEVLVGNQVNVRIQKDLAPVPTPALSRAIIALGLEGIKCDGILVTPSHNPPADGGIKYNPPHGGPADTDVTGPVQARANQLIAQKLAGVNRVEFSKAIKSEYLEEWDFLMPYVLDLVNVLDMHAIARSGVKLGVDPLGGASIHYWDVIADVYKLNLKVVNDFLDPTFAFMPLDHDGKIRMDCSSPWAMSGLVSNRTQFDVAFGTDPDSDRHGIVTKDAGLMNPNAYLAVAIDYLFNHRPNWGWETAVGKTLVSSSMIDRVAKALGRKLIEVPVGFKWFVPGLSAGTLGFGGEESAGASFLKFSSKVWSTDKDGILLSLLAAEITAVTGKDPGVHYDELVLRFGRPYYARLDAPANAQARKALGALTPDKVAASTLAGEPITARLTHAPGNGQPIGGLKIVTESGWFAARPSGTEDLYKIYAESFVSEDHLKQIQVEAKAIVSQVLESIKGA